MHGPHSERKIESSLAEKSAATLGFWLTLVLLCLCQGPSSACAQEKPDRPDRSSNDRVPTLESGQIVADVIAKDQKKVYQLSVPSGEFVRVTVEKGNLDLAVRVRGPRGADELKFTGPEEENILVPLLGSADGPYQLDIHLLVKTESEAHYRIRVSEPRAALLEDEQRVSAERAYAQAESLHRDRSAETLRKRLAMYEALVPAFRRLGDVRLETLTLSRLGTVHAELNEGKQALGYFQRALPLCRSQVMRRLEGLILHTMGVVYANQGDAQQAIEHYSQALVLHRQNHDERLEALALTTLGRNYERLGDVPKALTYYEQALPMWQSLDDHRGQGWVLSSIGEAQISVGEAPKAVESFRQGLEQWRASKDRRDEANGLYNMGWVHDVLGDLPQALDYYQQALTLLRAEGDQFTGGETLRRICLVQERLGQTEKALDCFGQALTLLKKVEARREQASTLTNIGEAYASLEKNKEAADYYQKALSLHRTVGDPRGEADTLNDLGDLRLRQGRVQDALDYYNQALTRCRSAEYLNGEAITLTNLGAAYLVLGDLTKALDYLNRSLDLVRATGDQLQETVALYQLARAERQAGRLDKAQAEIEQALELTERLRGRVAGSDVRASYLAKVRNRYELLIAILMQRHHEQPSQGFNAKAFEVSERARARGLLDLLSESHMDIRQGLDSALLEREHALQTALNVKAAYRIQLLSGKHTPQQVSDLEREINALTSDYEECEAQIRTASPNYAGLTQPRPLTAKEVQGLLDSDTVLLEYGLNAERSFLWLVTSSSVSSYELRGAAAIESVARRAYAELSTNNQPVQTEATRALGRILLGPVAGQLGKKRLLIVAEGALQYISFSALPTRQGVPLIAQHEVIYLPSASILAALRQEGAGREAPSKSVAVLADPVFDPSDSRVIHTSSRSAPAAPSGLLERSAQDTGLLRLDRLVASRQEANALVALAGKEASFRALDFEATRSTATSPGMSQYRFVHFASHALLNSRHPDLSGIVLSMVDQQGQPQNGFLRLRDIYNLKLNADLVVLSACQTALGKDVRGEGLIGLTRGFMYAGAPRVVASLWRVPDRATAELMKRFYRAMLVENLSPAAALRKSQISMAREKRWTPYHWAGFVLQGEWK